MRQYRIGTPGDLDSIRVEQADTPKPGPGQVLVRMRAFSLNYRDLMVATGRYGGKPAVGRVPLSDGAGEVVEAGPGTSRFKAGDRVASCFFSGLDRRRPAARIPRDRPGRRCGWCADGISRGR